MAILKKLDLKAKPILKLAGLAVVALIVVYIAFMLIGSLFVFMGSSYRLQTGSTASQGLSSNYSKSAPGMTAMDMSAPSLSIRNAEQSSESAYYQNNAPSGDAAEQFEVTEYRAQIKSRQTGETCGAVGSLKSRQDVIFETAREFDKGCNYTFKVRKDSTEEILAVIKELKPKELVGNTYTIQGQVEDFTSEIDILQRKLASIDDTLDKAIGAYDEVTKLATNVKDAESLAKIIDSKISAIERLTQQRISVNSQLDQIRRTKVLQLDRLDYTYFSVSVSDDSFIDSQSLKDAWNSAIKSFVGQINQTAMNLSINLASLLFTLLQYAVYAIILLFIAKYGWKLAKNIWFK